MKQNLTKKQAAVLECIRSFILRNGYSPTVRELAEELGYHGSATVHRHLDKLAGKGYISKEAGGPRTIRILHVETRGLIEVKSAQFTRMKAALQNILEMSSEDFSKHQARYGLGIDK